MFDAPLPPPSPTRGRVMMIAPQPFFRVTGTPINILYMCRALTELGYEVHLVTLPMGETVDVPGLVYHRVPRLPFSGDVPVGFSLAKAAYHVFLLPAVLRLLITHRFAAVHAIEESAFYAVHLARLFGAAAITDLDSDLCYQLSASRSPLVRALSSPARILRRWALRRSSGVLAVAASLVELARADSATVPVFEIKDIPPEESLRAPDAQAIDRLRHDLGLGARRVITYTGNFDGRQGVDVLVRAMLTVLRDVPDAMLLLVGGGDEQQERHLRSLTTDLGIETAVMFCGRRPVETMPEFMGVAEVLASPRQEPLVTPLKIFAYMASGRAIVATDFPTHSQVLPAGAAFLTPPTPEGMAAGLIQAFNDPAEAATRGARARALMLKHHTFDNFKRQLAEAYAVITGNIEEHADFSAGGAEPDRG